MTDILSDDIHTCRKAKTCDQCGRLINVGDRYRKQVYSDGGLQTYRAHEDCDQAYSAMRKNAGIAAWRDDDLFFPLSDIACQRDDAWIKDQFPAVAARLGWNAP